MQEANMQKAQVTATTFTGTLTAASVERPAGMCSQNQEWWDWEVMCFTDSDFFREFIIIIFNHSLWPNFPPLPSAGKELLHVSHQ